MFARSVRTFSSVCTSYGQNKMTKLDKLRYGWTDESCLNGDGRQIAMENNGKTIFFINSSHKLQMCRNLTRIMDFCVYYPRFTYIFLNIKTLAESLTIWQKVEEVSVVTMDVTCTIFNCDGHNLLYDVSRTSTDLTVTFNLVSCWHTER